MLENQVPRGNVRRHHKPTRSASPQSELISLATEKKSVSCLVCGQTARRDSLCELCYLAKEKLNQNYKLWNIAYGGLSYRDYLRLLVTLPETGETIRALARLILHDKGEADAKDTNHL